MFICSFSNFEHYTADKKRKNSSVKFTIFKQVPPYSTSLTWFANRDPICENLKGCHSSSSPGGETASAPLLATDGCLGTFPIFPSHPTKLTLSSSYNEPCTHRDVNWEPILWVPRWNDSCNWLLPCKCLAGTIGIFWKEMFVKYAFRFHIKVFRIDCITSSF